MFYLVFREGNGTNLQGKEGRKEGWRFNFEKRVLVEVIRLPGEFRRELFEIVGRTMNFDLRLLVEHSRCSCYPPHKFEESSLHECSERNRN